MYPTKGIWMYKRVTFPFIRCITDQEGTGDATGDLGENLLKLNT